jgi:hypothetical protein
MKDIWIGDAADLDGEPDRWASIVAKADDETRLLEMSDGEWLVQLPESYGYAHGFSNEKDARLFFGLWVRSGGFTTGESPTSNVPLAVAVEGKDALAAYLLVGAGVRNSRGFVAEKLDVSRQTVSNYANRVRWSE